MTKTVIAAALGECVHVAGVSNFLQLAEKAGWKTVFLGPATPIDVMLDTARKARAEMEPGDELWIGVSYRLTPETGERLLGQFAEEASDLRECGIRFVFGGTPPVAERVGKIGFFEKVFDGSESPEQVLAYLKGQPAQSTSELDYPQRVVERIKWRAPYPILRHHFGLPTMEATIEGIQKIAEAQAVDVISLGTDQDAQENFFHPERQDPRRQGAGGVPVRSRDDFRRLYEASRCGNFPLLRAYSGTDDFIRYAEVLTKTINNAWCAIPLFWFNQMDGRGPWDLEASIREHQKVMAWYGERGIPVELNEPHHWGMRDASDVVFVVAGFLSAYNAQKFGVRDYIAQMMFNSPPGTSDAMDLAKMLAILELIEPFQYSDFRVWRQTRIGLLSHPLDSDAARGHLAASTYLQMALKPHIYHIVGHTEAHHAATADDIIEASKIVRRAINNAMGAPSMASAPEVQARKEELISEATKVLFAIRDLAPKGCLTPWADAATLAKAVQLGILDAPQLKNNKFALGRVRTRIVNGACVEVDEKGKPLQEMRIGSRVIHLSAIEKDLEESLSIRHALRLEMIATHKNLHQTLEAISDETLCLPSKNPDWTNGELLYHISRVSRLVIVDLRIIRNRNRDYRWLPRQLFRFVNHQLTRFGARRLNRQVLKSEFERSFLAILNTLDTVCASDFEKSFYFPGWDSSLSGNVSLEQLLHFPKNHFDQHVEQLSSE